MDGKPSTSALKALSAHAGHDTSRQRDRFAPGPSGSSSSLRALPGSSSRQQQHPQQQAFDLAPLGQALPPAAAHPGQQWRADFGAGQQAFAPGGGGGGGGAMEAQWARAASAGPQAHHHHQHLQHPAHEHQWADGFAQHVSQQQQGPAQAGPASHQQQQQPGYQPSFGGMGMAGGMGVMGGGMMAGGGMYAPQPQQQPQLDNGKGKAQADEAWASAFGAFDEPAVAAEKAEEATVDDVKGKGKEPLSGPAEFERAWAEAHPQPAAEHTGTHSGVSAQADLASWESQFSQFANGESGESAEEAYREMMADQAAAAGVQESLQGSIDERGWPRLGAYAFESTNQFVRDPALASAGPPSSLSDRALFLEAALQQSSASAHQSARAQLDEARTWLDLGETQTQDEKELAGMRALEAARKAFEALLAGDGAGAPALDEAERAEAVDGLGRTLISLAVSYTNESYDEAAYLTLHRHLALQHPAHARPLPAPPAGGAVANPWEMHAVLTEGYLAVVRGEMADGRVVPESQMALGLLNYSQGEFERSADCWGAALGARPDDFLLWNRLGATLANGGKPEEAIGAYRRALELNPTFTRAVYNLGVSCLNIGIFKEAAEHLLSALSLHESSAPATAAGAGGLTTKAEAVNQSLNLWATLRRAFYSMDRPDLAEKALVGADLGQFRAEFEF